MINFLNVVLTLFLIIGIVFFISLIKFMFNKKDLEKFEKIEKEIK